MEENLHLKIDCASLKVGSKFTIFALFTLYLRAIFQVQALGGLYLELIFGGAYTSRGLFSEFCSNSVNCMLHHL